MVNLGAGKYVLAVSGGVDSMVLLDKLSKDKDLELVVAHYNHGIRDDAYLDEELVKKTAARYRVKFEVAHGNLSRHSGEELARQKRYEFLRCVAQKHQAEAIITAHHQDDLIETAFLNILRGTGAGGLTAILNNPLVRRPLIRTPKKEILTYAKKHKLVWREDSTNSDTKYLRNYIRKYLMPKLTAADRRALVESIGKIAQNQPEADKLIATLSQVIRIKNKINRQQFAALPTQLSNELVRYWLRSEKLEDFDKKTIERVNVALRTSAAGSRFPVKSNCWLEIKPETAHFTKTI